MATGSLIKSIILYNICFFFAVSDCLQWNQVSLSFITTSSAHRRTCSTSSKPFAPLPYHNIWLFFFLITSLVPNCLKLWMSEWNLLSHVQLFVAPWIIQSMEFSLGQNTFLSPGHLPNSGIKPRSSALQAHSLSAEPQGKPLKLWRAYLFWYWFR